MLKAFTLARLKTVAAVIGGLVTTATLLDWGFDIPTWVTALGTLLTAVSVYAVPNITVATEPEPQPRRALLDD